jgi:hypothetical protein
MGSLQAAGAGFGGTGRGRSCSAPFLLLLGDSIEDIQFQQVEDGVHAVQAPRDGEAPGVRVLEDTGTQLDYGGLLPGQRRDVADVGHIHEAGDRID